MFHRVMALVVPVKLKSIAYHSMMASGLPNIRDERQRGERDSRQQRRHPLPHPQLRGRLRQRRLLASRRHRDLR